MSQRSKALGAEDTEGALSLRLCILWSPGFRECERVAKEIESEGAVRQKGGGEGAEEVFRLQQPNIQWRPIRKINYARFARLLSPSCQSCSHWQNQRHS